MEPNDRPPLGRRSSIPQHQLTQDILTVSRSVVKIYTSFSQIHYNQPWQLNRGSTATSSGFVIEKNGERFILCNAHGVSHFTSVSVKKTTGGSRKYLAKVLCVADTCDLALLTVEDPTFWYHLPALPLGDLPLINTKMYVLGFPLGLGGDEISYTQGVVSRIGVNSYAHSGESYLTIQTDTAINSGNSGGPCVALNENGCYDVVGVAFETLNNANSIGYAIATTVVQHFLESFITHNVGTSSLNIITQSIESQILRDSLFIPPLSGLVDYLYDCSQIPIGGLLSSSYPSSLLEPDTFAPTSSSSSSSSSATTSTSSSTSSSMTTRMRRTSSSARNLDKGTDLTSCVSDRRKSLVSSQVYKALHTIIDQDDDWDYVIFHPINPTNSPPCNNIDSHLNTTAHHHTPVYRLQRKSIDSQPEEKQVPPDTLLRYLNLDSVNDTAIGISVAAIVPFTASSQLLQPGDVILTINNVPIASDQTIPLRGTERVKYSHLISSAHIGDIVTVHVARGFDILTLSIPVEHKQYIAKWSQYTPPQWLCCLSLVCTPLTSNLMASEYGSDWSATAPVPLLESLFTGTLQRSSPDEECVILTQILSHPSSEGYDYSMRRITHVNGEKVNNLKHLATIVNHAVKVYEHALETKQIQQELRPPQLISCSQPVSQEPIQHPSTEKRPIVVLSPHFEDSMNPDDYKSKLMERQEICLLDADGNRLHNDQIDELYHEPIGSEPIQPHAMDNILIDMNKPSHRHKSTMMDHIDENNNNNNHDNNNNKDNHDNHKNKNQQHHTSTFGTTLAPLDTTSQLPSNQSPQEPLQHSSQQQVQSPQSKNPQKQQHSQASSQVSPPVGVGSPTIGCCIDTDDDMSSHRKYKLDLAAKFYSDELKQEEKELDDDHNQQTDQTTKPPTTNASDLAHSSRNTAYTFIRYTHQLYEEARLKYLTFTLQNGHTIVLSLENGQSNQLDILKLHQIPVPGCSSSILPMYELEVNVVTADGGTVVDTVKPLHATPQRSSTPLQQQLSTGGGGGHQTPSGQDMSLSPNAPTSSSRPGIAPRGYGTVTPRETKIYHGPIFNFPPPLQHPQSSLSPTNPSHPSHRSPLPSSPLPQIKALGYKSYEEKEDGDVDPGYVSHLYSQQQDSFVNAALESSRSLEDRIKDGQTMPYITPHSASPPKLQQQQYANQQSQQALSPGKQ